MTQTPPRMTSLDRKIEAARLLTERERAAQGQMRMPTEGLTSTMSTENNDVPNTRKQPPLGLSPAEFFSGTLAGRYAEVARAMNRFKNADMSFPATWLDESQRIERAAASAAGFGCTAEEIASLDYQASMVQLSMDESKRDNAMREAGLGKDGFLIVEDTAQDIRRLIQQAGLDRNAEDLPNGITFLGGVNIHLTESREEHGLHDAMETLRKALVSDPYYAGTWHDNLATAFYDELKSSSPNPGPWRIGIDRKIANCAASRFLAMLAPGCDTRPHAERVTKPDVDPVRVWVDEAAGMDQQVLLYGAEARKELDQDDTPAGGQ
jgi:hypothetical protein